MIKVILVELELEHPMYDLKYSDCHEILGAIGRTQEPSIWRNWKNTRLNNFCGIEKNHDSNIAGGELIKEGTHGSINLVEWEEPMVEDISTQL